MPDVMVYVSLLFIKRYPLFLVCVGVCVCRGGRNDWCIRIALKCEDSVQISLWLLYSPAIIAK